MSLDLADDKSVLVQVMASCRQATSHYQSQCWPWAKWRHYMGSNELSNGEIKERGFGSPQTWTLNISLNCREATHNIVRYEHKNINLRTADNQRSPSFRYLPNTHDDVIKWKYFPRNWPFVRGIHRSPVNSPHKGQWRGALMFPLICARINGWVNNGEAGDMRRYRAHYDVTVMRLFCGGNAISMTWSMLHLSKSSQHGECWWSGTCTSPTIRLRVLVGHFGLCHLSNKTYWKSFKAKETK